MATAQELLDAIADYADARREGADEETLTRLVAKFDVTLGEAIIDRASVQNEA